MLPCEAWLRDIAGDNVCCIFVLIPKAKSAVAGESADEKWTIYVWVAIVWGLETEHLWYLMLYLGIKNYV